MKTITMILCLFAATAITSADDYSGTIRVRPFGRGTIAHGSHGSTMITQPFGRGYIARETHRGGSAIHIAQPFGRGYMIRSTGRGVMVRW